MKCIEFLAGPVRNGRRLHADRTDDGLTVQSNRESLLRALNIANRNTKGWKVLHAEQQGFLGVRGHLRGVDSRCGRSLAVIGWLNRDLAHAEECTAGWRSGLI